MRQCVNLAGLFVLSLLLVGCGNKGNNKLASVPVKGKVTLDGKDMPEGEITFEVVGEGPPMIFTITNGTFSGEANVGKNRVSVQSFKVGPPLSTEPNGPPTKVNFIPDRYNGHTTLEAVVTKDGANEFTFAVTSR